MGALWGKTVALDVKMSGQVLVPVVLEAFLRLLL